MHASQTERPAATIRPLHPGTIMVYYVVMILCYVDDIQRFDLSV